MKEKKSVLIAFHVTPPDADKIYRCAAESGTSVADYMRRIAVKGMVLKPKGESMQKNRPLIYRRDGTPYPDGFDGVDEWIRDYSDSKIKIVRQTPLLNGYWVSTVWLGLDHGSPFDDTAGPPIIFETTVFPSELKVADLARKRYSSEEEALVGHEVMCETWAKKEALIR